MGFLLAFSRVLRGFVKEIPISLPLRNGNGSVGVLIRRAVEGGFLSAASGLKINLGKSEIIPVGEVEDIEELAVEIGCRVGSLPSQYLGLPLGAPNKASRCGMEWKKEALLGKWIWRFACERENLEAGVWKEIMKETDWCWDNIEFMRCPKLSRTSFWLLKECYGGGDVGSDSDQGGWNLRFLRNFNDWEVGMVGDLLLKLRGLRPSLEEDSVSWKGGKKSSYQSRFLCVGGYMGEEESVNHVLIHCIVARALWELVLGLCVEEPRVTLEEDSVIWKEGRDGLFRVKRAYSVLASPIVAEFPNSNIWVDRVPTKIAFFAWEAAWRKVLTLDRLQRRGWQFPNCCFLCGCEEEMINHILIHCTVVRIL
ncbi:hypothetical protein CK203_055972 [Vitis vinifera]|uniref:Reverse transcriptase zinc-binding domain-containing protein n=1 Tax=Vitis vinifera TaxID=29760 RepID=A0A438GPV3_VITVI|nr:hypothetical protein CK203_055972 [Vitis vinifera]